MMQAVVFHGPYKVAVEQRPIPKVQNPEDIVVKVGYTALCGRYETNHTCTDIGTDFLLVSCTCSVAWSLQALASLWAMSLWERLLRWAVLLRLSRRVIGLSLHLPLHGQYIENGLDTYVSMR
jgi:hypothetical protein